ncbi:hypothetical protein SCHPADRAFT_223992 [Schizopora paradoxa]|uniref:DUF6533 domain-containing protein n=1 Tax=Schizopora paradoxa TaxID=27342 RepID=A0A0H2RVU0_9AGAM|nr:hypothetical protein SCHPADRAFT_223992 [Schizopora paradoxa]
MAVVVPLNPTTVDQYYILASSVVFLYDFALTVPQEIKFLWNSKFKLVNGLVMALRYITVLGYIPVLLLAFMPSTGDTLEIMVRII